MVGARDCARARGRSWARTSPTSSTQSSSPAPWASWTRPCWPGRRAPRRRGRRRQPALAAPAFPGPLCLPRSVVRVDMSDVRCKWLAEFAEQAGQETALWNASWALSPGPCSCGVQDLPREVPGSARVRGRRCRPRQYCAPTITSALDFEQLAIVEGLRSDPCDSPRKDLEGIRHVPISLKLDWIQGNITRTHALFFLNGC